MAKYKIGEICQIVSGSTPKTSVNEYWDGNIKWITPAEINEDTYIVNDSERKISELAVEKNHMLSFPKGTVILSSRAPIGKVAIAGCEMYCNQGFKNLICSNVINNKYLYWFLKEKKGFLNSLGRGATFKEISKSIISKIEIEVPSKEKQEDIVEILEKINNIIKDRKREICALDNLIKARFVEMFGDPIYNTNKLPIKRLNDLGEWASGGTPSRAISEYFEGDINWYSAGELNTLFLEKSLEKITEEAIEKSSTKLFKAGSMLVGMYDTAAFKMGILKEDSASNQACACITPNDRINIIWLYYELQLMKEYFLSQRRGVRQKNLNLAMIKGFEIPIANRDKQDEFVRFVNQVNKSKVAVQKALDEAQLLFDSLMQEYFG